PKSLKMQRCPDTPVNGVPRHHMRAPGRIRTCDTRFRSAIWRVVRHVGLRLTSADAFSTFEVRWWYLYRSCGLHADCDQWLISSSRSVSGGHVGDTRWQSMVA